VKILAGAEYGMAPIDAMRSFHILSDGKIEPTASLLARALKASTRYDYTVAAFTDEAVEVLFWENGDEAGVSRFTMADARAAGLIKPGGAWAKYPRNMMFNRAITNGVAWFAPDVLATVGSVDDSGAPSAVNWAAVEPADPAPSGPEEAPAYGEGASGSEGPANVEVVGSGDGADGGDNPDGVPLTSEPDPAAPHEHRWTTGAHGLDYCAEEGCFTTRKAVKV
jgi:hypothetical protein